MTGRLARPAGLFVLALALVAAWAPLARAHGGHAGPMVTFVETSEALKAMLPEGARVTRRKEALSADGVAWAREAFGVTLKPDVYVYYLARDRESGAVVGGAIVRELKYAHAEVNLALGLDAAGHVTRAALLGTNQQFVPEFRDGVGSGDLADLAGLSVADLGRRAKETPEPQEARRFVLDGLHDMAAVLAALLHGVRA